MISLTDTDVYTALRAFLLAVLPNVEVVQLQDNGVPMPTGPFVGMNSTAIKRLATNIDSYGITGIKQIEVHEMYSVALDFYGAGSAGNAAIVQAVFRDESATELFPATVSPLYCDDPLQVPLINGEQQYEERWRVTAALQINPIVTLNQDSANSLVVHPVSVESVAH